MPYLVKTLPVDPQTDCDTQSMHTVLDYIWKSKTQPSIELTEFNKFVGYKINTQKSSTFLYTNNEITEKKTEKTNPITASNKQNKVLNKFKWGRERFIYKIRKNWKSNKQCKDTLCSWAKELTLWKCPITQSHIQIQCKLYKNSNDDFLQK